MIVFNQGLDGLNLALGNLCDSHEECEDEGKYCSPWMNACENKADDGQGCDLSLAGEGSDSWEWIQESCKSGKCGEDGVCLAKDD